MHVGRVPGHMLIARSPQCSFAMPVLICLEYNSIEETMKLLSPQKSTLMNCLDSYYIETYQQKDFFNWGADFW
jgi:hypothetical protein